LSGVTVRVVELDTPLNVAVIVVVPVPTAMASPFASMVATDVLDELHVAEAVISWLAGLVNVPVAVNCWVVPAATLGLAGVTVRDDIVPDVTVRVDTGLVTPAAAAVICVVPAARPEAFPFALIVATDVLVECQVADAVRS
jgi:hypothetical protein